MVRRKRKRSNQKQLKKKSREAIEADKQPKQKVSFFLEAMFEEQQTLLKKQIENTLKQGE